MEVNARVNYPMKNARLMEEVSFIDMENDEDKFCVSAVSHKLAAVGLNKVVQSWNCHPIPGNILTSNNRGFFLKDSFKTLVARLHFPQPL